MQDKFDKDMKLLRNQHRDKVQAHHNKLQPLHNSLYILKKECSIQCTKSKPQVQT